MDELIKQIRAATEADFYYLALMGALMLPDICGALASENGRATASKFKDWLIANVPEQAASAAEIYGLSGARYCTREERCRTAVTTQSPSCIPLWVKFTISRRKQRTGTGWAG